MQILMVEELRIQLFQFVKKANTVSEKNFHVAKGIYFHYKIM